MIDNVRITLRDFTGNFDNCRRKGKALIEHPEDRDYDNYTLSNNSSVEPYKLNVTKRNSTNSVVIYGSLRKWYFNGVSLRDLNSQRFSRVLRKLAKALNISTQELCEGKITQCEIGLNVMTRNPVRDIIPLIVDYAHLDKNPDGLEYEGTAYFIGSSKRLKFYDKTAEIVAKNRKKQDLRRQAFAVFEEKGYNYLRIEFTLYNQKAFNQHDMNYIRTLGDVVANYSCLYDFWSRELSRIVMFNGVEIADIMTQKELLLGASLNYLGFEQMVEEYRSRCKSRTDKGLVTARSKAYKEIISVIDRFAHPGYGKNSLRSDITKTLIKISKDDDAVHFPTVFRNLWGLNKVNRGVS